MPTRKPSSSRGDVPTRLSRLDDSDEYRDLCSNCDHGDECVDGTRPRRPIFFCEHFEVFGAAPTLEPARAARVQASVRPSTNGHIGLCMNCDNARICVMPKPEGGVWHCEEYR